MNTPPTREETAAFVFARAIGVGLASLLLELVLPFATSRSADALVASPIDLVGLASGAVFRFPLVVAVFALVASLFGESPRKSVGRFVVLVLMAAVLFVDATSYRWLGEQGLLLHLRGTFAPLRAFAPARLVTTLLAGLAATIVAAGIASRLEPRLAIRFARKGVLAADALTWALGAALAAGAAAAGPATTRVGVTPPLVALFMLPPADRSPPTDVAAATPPDAEATLPADGIAIPPDEVRDLVLGYQATQDPEPLADPARPFCRANQTPTRAATPPRSVTLLVLRGVGLEASRGERRTMPALAALAAAEASFENVIAGADDPTQGLAQILGGVAPLAPTRYHELGIVPRLPSLPRALRGLGIHSEFVSSYDLSPGRERTLVAGLAFDRVDEPSFADEAASEREAGDDDATLAAVLARLDATRGSTRLVVATLATGFTTLAPTPGPVAARTAGASVDAGVASADAGVAVGVAPSAGPHPLTVLDQKLAAFVSAWREKEASSGGVLVIVGDSVATPITASDAVATISDPRFHVPFVLVNLRADERARVAARRRALGGLLDVGQTVLGLEGQGPVGCFQGRDLLATEPVPGGRRLTAFAGPDQQYAYVFDGRFRWQIDRTGLQDAFAVYDLERDPLLVHDLYDANDDAVGSTRDYLLASLGLGRYLATNDRYVLGESQIVVTPLPPVTRPAQIGNGVGDDLATLLGSITRFRAASLGAVLVPITLDASLEPVVVGTPLAQALPQLVRAARGGTLAFDIALPDIASPTRSVDAARRIARAIASATPPRDTSPGLLLLPRDPVMAMSLSARSPHTVYVRVPGNSPDFVEVARSFGADGIVFDAAETQTLPIERARLEGLRVVVAGVPTLDTYTSDASAEVARPDFIVLAPSSASSVASPAP